LGCAKTLPQECAGFGCPDRILKRFGDLANEAGIILANVNLKTNDASLFLTTAIGGQGLLLGARHLWVLPDNFRNKRFSCYGSLNLVATFRSLRQAPPTTLVEKFDAGCRL